MRSVMNIMRLFVAWLPWKPCSWYSTCTKPFELNRSVTEWRCLVWEIIMGELILMNLCRPALGVQFLLRHSVESLSRDWQMCINLQSKNATLEVEKESGIRVLRLSPRQHSRCFVHSCNKATYQVLTTITIAILMAVSCFSSRFSSSNCLILCR